MSFFKKLGKGLKKALPFAAAALPFIPGVGTALSGAIGTIGGMLGRGSSAQAPPDPRADENGLGSDVLAGQASVPIYGKREPNPASEPNWMGLLKDAAPSFLSYLGQKQTNAANAQQAQKQMDFQAEQTGTSYQRGVADMKAAGLNPMLAYSQGGAASGTGASAQMGSELGAGVATAMQAQMQKGQLEALSATVENTRADTGNKETSNELIQAQAEKTRRESATELLRPGLLTAQERELVLRNLLGERTLDANVRAGHSAADFAADHAAREKALRHIDEQGKAKADAYAEYYRSGVGKSEPDMHYWTTVTNSAANAAGAINPFKGLLGNIRRRGNTTPFPTLPKE